ncbi:chemotaxis protein CheW [Alteromonas facilis]|uniref:chemotaxis protein CheW n=1 Tax=Alteromonas facilis TaxID=2048004 RepID=UPI000C283A71|nr:chemotaxis protein CheW [Alteromonas facilis]
MNTAMESNLELLSLDVGGDLFAINITDVQEVRVLESVRRLPDLPFGWLGVIDFREAIVPIVDLRIVLGSDNTSIGDKTVVVIVQAESDSQSRLLGIVVDAVSDVMSVKPNDIRQPPNVKNAKNKVIFGLFKRDANIILLLDIEQLLESSDFEEVRSQISDVSSAE